MPRQDLSGQQFGRWRVISFSHSRGGLHWICRCDCGTEKVVRGDSLRAGASTSCGCHAAELAAARRQEKAAQAPRGYVDSPDGADDSPVGDPPAVGGVGPDVVSGRQMVARGRSVTVAEWAGPDATTFGSIDRAGWVAGQKRPGAVRAVAGPDRVLEHEGRSLTVREWAKVTGIRVRTILSRLDHYGWPVEKALTAPLQERPGT